MVLTPLPTYCIQCTCTQNKFSLNLLLCKIAGQNRSLYMYTSIQLLHTVTGSMAFCTLEGENGTQGCVQNLWTPVTACNNCFVIPLYNCYSSSRSSVVIFKHYYDAANKKLFPRTRSCLVHSAGNRPTPGTIKVMYTRCTSLFMLPGPSSHVTCVFVALHMIGSRPIKLHSLLPRYNNHRWYIVISCFGW